MQCPHGCPCKMEERKEIKIFSRDGEPVVISGLNMYVCPECGQEFTPLSSARMIEDILNGKVKPTGQFIADLYEINSTE